MFLHQLAADEINERLGLINKKFTRPAIVTGHPDLWGDQFPGSHIVADKDVLDLEPESYDLVIHAMGLHWADDAVGQLVQARRALQPDGLFLGCLFGGQTLHELRAVLAEAEIAVRSGISPRVVPMAEIRDIGGLLQRAGLSLPVADVYSQKVTYPSVLALMHDLRHMGEGNALLSRDRRSLGRKGLQIAEELYRSRFSDSEGRLTATFEIIFLSGWAPHPGQQKPLRPGSASHSLAQVLTDLRRQGD